MDKPKKVILGISGGIDSAMSAVLLKEKGHEVMGIYFEMQAIPGHLRERLKQIEQVTGINIHIADLKSQFSHRVIQPILAMYKKGFTPSVCTICNKQIKWHYLKQWAANFGCTSYATGHYAGKTYYNGHYYLCCATDPAKDQTYYLWDVPERIIRNMVLPLEHYTKEQVKELAQGAGLGFLLAHDESRGTCFMQHQSLEQLYEQQYPGELHGLNRGKVLSPDGEVLGWHKGYPLYTVGQQRGITLHKNGKWAVKKTDAHNNILYVDKPGNLTSRHFSIYQAHFINEHEVLHAEKLKVLVRGFGWNPEGYAQVKRTRAGSYDILLDKPAWAPCPGQPAVLYHNGRLLGGGLISHVSFSEAQV